MVCPQHVWQLVYPFSLCLIQPFFQSIDYDFVDSFRLPIPLWIGWGEVSVLDAQLAAIPLKCFTIKLKPVVRD